MSPQTQNEDLINSLFFLEIEKDFCCFRIRRRDFESRLNHFFMQQTQSTSQPSICVGLPDSLSNRKRRKNRNDCFFKEKTTWDVVVSKEKGFLVVVRYRNWLSIASPLKRRTNSVGGSRTSPTANLIRFFFFWRAQNFQIKMMKRRRKWRPLSPSLLLQFKNHQDAPLFFFYLSILCTSLWCFVIIIYLLLFDPGASLSAAQRRSSICVG